MHQNFDSEGINCLIDFSIISFIDFPSIWVANLGLCWALRHAQDASKTLPRRLQEGSQDEVRDIFAIFIEFWSILGRLLVDSL